MQRTISILTSILLVLLITACRRETATTDTGTTTTVTAADTAPATDTGTTAATSTSTNPDYQFALNFTNANLAEIEMGKLAKEKGTSADVKAFGDLMVTDHTQLGLNYEPIASAQGLPIATKLNPQFQAEYDHLKSLSGAAFDKSYAQHAVQDHQGAVTLFTTESQSGQDPQLKAFATQSLPIIQEHLRLATELDTKVQ
ncbi:MAG: DUF4142 domain-containing protein [Thermoanaerobaculia bacterium]